MCKDIGNRSDMYEEKLEVLQKKEKQSSKINSPHVSRDDDNMAENTTFYNEGGTHSKKKRKEKQKKEDIEQYFLENNDDDESDGFSDTNIGELLA